jgi:two-component system response regulator PilR (NtrC family)
MPPSLSVLVPSSREMQAVCRLITRVAFRRYLVLIMGESGTAKERAARAVHAEGPWRARRFVPVDCGALTPTLIESELFGIEGGLINR